MSAFANVIPTPLKDGIAYAKAVPLTSNEADVANTATPWYPDPVPLSFQQALIASIVLTATGSINTNASYVVLQTDLGDGQWVDVAWVNWSGTSGSATFIMSVMANPAVNAVAQQTRAAGTAPAGNGQNQIALGARFRFVGKASVNAGSSSSSSAATPGVTVAINFKLLGLR